MKPAFLNDPSLNPWQQIYKHSRGLIIRLIGLTLTGVALTAIGQPSSSNPLPPIERNFWFFLFAVHLLFLLFLTINAITILVLTTKRIVTQKSRALIGTVTISFGTINGILSFRGIYPAVTLFCVGLVTVILAIVYTPLFFSNRSTE